MDALKIQRIGGLRSRSTSCAPSFIEEARRMNRQVRLAKTRNKLRKFSDFSQLEEYSETCEYNKGRLCLISSSSDDLQTNCDHTSSKSFSNLISVHGSRFGGSVEVNCIEYCVTSYLHNQHATWGTCGIILSFVYTLT